MAIQGGDAVILVASPSNCLLPPTDASTSPPLPPPPSLHPDLAGGAAIHGSAVIPAIGVGIQVAVFQFLARAR